MAKAPTVCIIGAGAAGLVTAHTLLQDGFDVTVLTRDPSVGGMSPISSHQCPD